MQKKGENVMRIAVTYENGEVFQHFGRTENFKIYEVENNKIVNSQVMGSNGIGHGALAGLLSGNQIDVLICGGIGGGAQVALANAGITLCSGASGDTDKAVEAYLRGELILCRVLHAATTVTKKDTPVEITAVSPLIINIQEYL